MLIKSFPDLDIHASTQMTVHNLQGVFKLQELGFKSVVLSRELSIQKLNIFVEIQMLKSSALYMELYVFLILVNVYFLV